MLWDKAIGYYWCPLNTIPFSKQVTPQQHNNLMALTESLLTFQTILITTLGSKALSRGNFHLRLVLNYISVNSLENSSTSFSFWRDVRDVLQ